MGHSAHHIVCIDDSLGDTMLLRLAFDSLAEPYDLKVLPDGEAAILYLQDYCGRQSEKPCLFIVDLHLPKYDGITVLKSIQAHPTLLSVSVAVLTSQASPRESATVQALGVALYRSKPFQWDETLELARELFKLCKGSPLTAGKA
jgi:DNA-binding response OmpR family regulator